MIIDDYLGESVVKAAHHVHEAGETLNRLYNLQVTSNLSELIAMLTNEHGKVPTGGVTMYMSCIWKDGMKSFLFSPSPHRPFRFCPHRQPPPAGRNGMEITSRLVWAGSTNIDRMFHL